jgi:hypothetical protein
LTDTVASAPRVVLTASEDREQPPVQTPMAAIQLTIDAPSEGSESTVPAPSLDGTEPPAIAEETASDARPLSGEPKFYDTPPLKNEPMLISATASDQPAVSQPEIPNRNTPPTIETGEIEFVQYPMVTVQDSTLAPNDAEQIVTPGPIPRSPFRPGADESDQDRFTRRVVDVPLDIRPTEGAMPEDLAAAKFAEEPTIDETFPSDLPPDIFCSHSSWTFCYRPLYYEDIKLERYGENVGKLQTGLSGVRFFGSILALPYKMTVRPPRSCQCSNGFSRCGDCPLPGYGRREFRIDASLIEAAAVAGVVYILP